MKAVYRKSASLLLATLLSASALAGCAKKYIPPEIDYDDAAPAMLTADPVVPVKVVELPKPLPLPGQLKPIDGEKAKAEPVDPKARITQANEAARIQPVRDGFINAVQVYPFSGGALYQVYAAPGQVTDVALQPGEQLVGSGPVAAGDTVRWIIGDTESGTASSKQVHSGGNRPCLRLLRSQPSIGLHLPLAQLPIASLVRIDRRAARSLVVDNDFIFAVKVRLRRDNGGFQRIALRLVIELCVAEDVDDPFQDVAGGSLDIRILARQKETGAYHLPLGNVHQGEKVWAKLIDHCLGALVSPYPCVGTASEFTLMGKRLLNRPADDAQVERRQANRFIRTFPFLGDGTVKWERQRLVFLPKPIGALHHPVQKFSIPELHGSGGRKGGAVVIAIAALAARK